MKTSPLAIFFATVAIPFESVIVSAAPGFYRQRAHNPQSCEDMAEMKNQRSSLIEVLDKISDENELAATIATWEAEKKSRQQQNLEANCGGGRIRLLRGARGRHQNGDGNGANCDDGEDCEQQRLGPQMNGGGDGDGMDRHRGDGGGMFGTGECDGECSGQQRGDGRGRGHGGGGRKGNNGLFAILRDATCEDKEDVNEIIRAIDALVEDKNSPPQGSWVPSKPLSKSVMSLFEACELEQKIFRYMSMKMESISTFGNNFRHKVKI